MSCTRTGRLHRPNLGPFQSFMPLSSLRAPCAQMFKLVTGLVFEGHRQTGGVASSRCETGRREGTLMSLVHHLFINFFVAQEYFKAAAKYLKDTAKTPAAADISGVWLSSDDESVLTEVGVVQCLDRLP